MSKIPFEFRFGCVRKENRSFLYNEIDIVELESWIFLQLQIIVKSTTSY